VALAGDGHEGYEKATQLQPDLIVMDLSLPGWMVGKQRGV